ncbi:MAG: hypothetical protein LZ161_02780 [Thaumarchaeota archaeon]|jgi:ABC-type antimicrobial peptide transport system permease subunit|nr:hypothetical protein [Candidatus Terraquivivens yellowstonensis]MCL7392175.1 hypothetical protein [Candidatus Terraquivivens yellowstonensis]MCL7395137.1 hypothetical protein [Candidatus Terraquivivens yellowstonensis]
MVSWGTAFKKAMLYVGFLIMWLIIGGVIFGVGFIIGGFGIQVQEVQLGPFSTSMPVPTMVNPLAFVIAVIISYIVVILGTIATFFKIIAEITAEEVERKLKTSSS